MWGHKTHTHTYTTEEAEGHKVGARKVTAPIL